MAPASQVNARSQHRSPYTFDLISGVTTDPFYLTMLRGARAAARAYGVHVVSLGSPDSFRASEQIPYINLAIQQHADAILLAPTGRAPLAPSLAAAHAAGIPVITLDTSTGSPIPLTRITSRNAEGGRLAAKALARAMGYRGSVLLISVNPGAAAIDRRQRGFKRQLSRYPNMRYVGIRYTGYNVLRAEPEIARVLKHHPTLGGIASLDAVSGQGVIAAVTAPSRQRQPARPRIKLVEFDTEPVQVYTLRRGTIDALIAQDPFDMGTLAVALAEKHLSGRLPAVQKHYFTREAIITRANVDARGVQRLLYSGK
ncbi:MAG: substrate-binding domain-containing protein [Chloroflexota bacterium]